MLRGQAIPLTTTDQRLLDRRGPSDWVHTDPWRVLRIQAEFVEGFGLLAELGMAVSVFGSSRARPGSARYSCALSDGGLNTSSLGWTSSIGGARRVKYSADMAGHSAPDITAAAASLWSAQHALAGVTAEPYVLGSHACCSLVSSERLRPPACWLTCLR